jgi:UDP-3-O-[3-hydroxymyristoyl] glucosamine N-acyltransferase
MKLRELAGRLACRLEGDGEIDIVRVAGIQDAGPGDLTFVANPKYLSALSTTRASAVVLRDDASAPSIAVLRAADPYLAFARAVGLFAPAWKPAPGVHAMAAIAGDATLGADVSIGAFVAVGEGASIGDRTIVFPNVTIGPGARIGADCIVHSNVAIRERVSIGDRVILQNGVVVGGDGYGFVRRGDGTHEKIPQVATVVIEDDVELGANTTVDRPAVGETRIKAGTKIDNLVQVAHGVVIGRNVLMAAQVGIAGSTEIGDDVMFGGQVGVGGHLTIGRGVVAVGQSGITNSVDPGTMVAGYPAIDARQWRRASAVFRRLPELKKRIEELEARLAELEGRLGSARDNPKDSE